MKAAALTYHNNGAAADVIGILAAGLMAFLDYMGVLPAWGKDVDNSYFNLWCPGGPATIDVRAWASLGFVVGRGCGLLWFHHIDCIRANKGIFLDKLCIHQMDAELKQEGVRLLGHFLAETDEMLLLLDSTYLQRLWCVFELATFFALNPDGKLTICPISMTCVQAMFPMVMGTCVVIFWLFISTGLLAVATNFLVDFVGSEVLATCCVFWFGGLGAVGWACCFGLRKFARARINVTNQLKSFSIDNANCALEADRQFVKDRVCELYGDVQWFESYAREAVQSKLINLWGPHFEFNLLMGFRALPLVMLLFQLDAMLMLRHADRNCLLHMSVGVCLGPYLLHAATCVKLGELAASVGIHRLGPRYDVVVSAVQGFAVSIYGSFILGNGRWMLTSDIGTQVPSLLAIFFIFVMVWGRSIFGGCMATLRGPVLPAHDGCDKQQEDAGSDAGSDHVWISIC